jgi:alkylation response protein AidB-like acyl-CoA dehydrogenase
MSTPTAVLTDEEVTAWFRDGAAAVDRGDREVRDGLRWLGERGLIAPAGAGLPHAVDLVERIAGECLSSAFSLWAHRMVIEYLSRGEPDGGAVLAELSTGRAVGSTAMAPALRDVAGLEPVPVLARRDGSGLRLTGPIRWASNLFDDAVVVLPVRLADSEPGGRAVVRIRLSDPGVLLDRRPELLALNGTASSSARLDDVPVPAEAVLSADLRGFVGAIRPAFLLLQSAFCAGLALRSVHEAGRHTSGPNAELAGDLAELVTRADSVHRRLHTAAADPTAVSHAGLLRLRLDAADTASAATRIEATLRGGAGYLAGSDVSRRLREGAFLPIQAPTEGQLRWELSRCA